MTVSWAAMQSMIEKRFDPVLSEPGFVQARSGGFNKGNG